ncbi:MAG TPA: DUF411 domain-containing protein [Sinorhizobium sp.]|nr:DUF411 domain-containing protein [Sinorhizobium sp.]
MITSLVVGAAARAEEIEVFKSKGCSCCGLWIDHLKRHAFTPAPKNAAPGELARIKAAAGLMPELQSCHTGKVAGYVIEGHVPAADIKRLLAEKPDAIGLTVPGLPIGSPGMEVGDRREPYEVLLVRRDGTTEVFARY